MYSGKDPPSLALLTHLHNNQALLEKLPSIPHIVKAKVKAPVSLGEKVQIPALLCLLALEGRERGQRVSQGHQASQRPKDRAEEREVWAQPGPERTSFKSRRKPADLSAAAWNAPARSSRFFILATPKSHLDFISSTIPFNCLIS